ncbi:hypothetical protein [Methanococcoides alaskense]|uniref:Uncharacterized protein n=1 Tax=Methanococcoides alaskense TaxID=325778 RepID=A0AA90ZE03_9EURY|nr:hypothetical protein [Methanococcoides alaskense]MDA0525798.1 hypothetical protein [Methanococcoides alaskense]MDR6224002.1 hypothetical protein [Methanococcoides alaskense]
MTQILTHPWTKVEKIFFDIASNKDLSYNQSELDTSLSFLKGIYFIDKNCNLTDIGKSYYTEKFVLADEDQAFETLSCALKKTKPVHMICQIMWGKTNISKDNILNLLHVEKILDSSKKVNLGSFLFILNKCNIISYDKKSGLIKILYNPLIENISTKSLFIAPEKPFTNVMHLRKILAECDGYIWWLDKHFGAKGFEPLVESVDANKVEHIKILTGNPHIDEKMKNDFKRFKEEMKNRGIDAECRVILDKGTFHDIHDRWIISKDLIYNVPPINSIYKGQFSEINITNKMPPFEKWWDSATELFSGWNHIQNSKK